MLSYNSLSFSRQLNDNRGLRKFHEPLNCNIRKIGRRLEIVSHPTTYVCESNLCKKKTGSYRDVRMGKLNENYMEMLTENSLSM